MPAEHKHSLIENSPLGDIDRKMTPQKMAMLQALAEKRFRETYPGR